MKEYLMKEIMIDSLKLFNRYNENIKYLNKNGIHLINNSFDYDIFGKYKARITLNRLFPLFRNKCYITLSFDSVTNNTFDDISLILKTKFGEANFYQNSHMQYWRNKNYNFYHTLAEDRLGNLYHNLVFFLKPFATLLPSHNYIQFYQAMKDIEKNKGITLKWFNASTAVFAEDDYEYSISFNKKKLIVYLRKNTQIDQKTVSNSHVKSYTKLVEMDKMDVWVKALNELIETARDDARKNNIL